VKFTEWTADHHLRHPVFLGLRDDKAARDVVRESTTRHHGSVKERLAAKAPAPVAKPSRETKRSVRSRTDTTALVEQLDALEKARKDGVLDLPGGETLTVTNLHKVFWPQLSLTKGDLFRYYVQVAPYILPVLADRPLVMKRYPNGVEGKPFYQHRAQDVQPGVRVQEVPAADNRPHLIGGDLKTLLYTCQLGAISQDPWFSRVDAPGVADSVALDLDPSDNVPFSQVLDVARWLHEELQTLQVFSLPKTSGSSGLHIFIPLAAGTPYEAGLLFCQLVATLVAEKHPREATIERSVRERGKRVYIDYLQNIEGKTLASAYSVRANAHAGVSAPLTWKEVDKGVEREAFTLRTMGARLKKVGDLWEGLRTAPGANLRDVTG
jgi:bifunctional non-homologous end joining protein LigD